MQRLMSFKRRWDSSDPDRAPPPLPLPPGVNTPTTKANTSAGIAAAAKQFVEKARENQPLSSYTSNNTPHGSPERSLIKGTHHRRMQSFQSGNVKDLRNYLDGQRNSQDRPSSRPDSRSGGLSSFSRQQSTEDVFSPGEQASTPTPAQRERDPMKDTPTLRPSSRHVQRPILGENTPPSAVTRALSSMNVPEDALSDITNNGPSTPSPGRVHNNYDFSSQLLNLTKIATDLQKEMTSLSRRSKDNATDLIGLKDATNQRDEDIRKSLRELANAVGTTQNLLGPPPPPPAGGHARSGSFSAFLDQKAFNSPPSASKSWTMPGRAASAHSFLDDRMPGSPSPYSVEGAASVAMLEKIIREMVTKEGQERLLGTLSELLDKSQKENVEAAKKVEELSDFIKQISESRALVPLSKDGPPKLDLDFDTPREAPTHDSMKSGAEILQLLNRVQESVAHCGGSTSEVKGIVRDLRGEVLGMGRELGRKMDQVSETNLNSSLDKGIEDGEGQQHAAEMQRILEEGMQELKAQLSGLLQQRAEQDDNAFKQLTTARSGAGADEMFAVVKTALAEHGAGLTKRDAVDGEIDTRLDREGVLDAVKEGLKDFEPNIELQQFGLERDEILKVLQEGLEDYQNNNSAPSPASIDKGEIFEVMQEALKDFQAPFPAEPLGHMKEEILENVRTMLAEYQPASNTASFDQDAMHAAVMEAVKAGIGEHGPAAPREIEISRDDLFDAVKASLDGSTIPFGGFGEQVLQQLHELIDGMRGEFKQYSAANGRDTEQVLDAVKDGLESLRSEIESYVDRAQDVTGKDEIVDTVKVGLEQLRTDVQGYVAEGPSNDGGKAEMLDYIKAEFEHLHEAIGNRETTRGEGEEGDSKPETTAAIILAVKEGMDSLKAAIGEKDRELEIDFPTDEINDAMKDEFEQLKTAILGANASDKSELMETIQDSMGALHSKLTGSEMSNLGGGNTEDIINEMHAEFSTLKESLQAIVGEADREPILEGLRQAIEDLRTQLSSDQSEASAEALGGIKEELEKFKETMGSSLVPGGASGPDHTEALDGIRTMLHELKEATATRSESEGGVPVELLEAMRGEFENLRNSMSTSMVSGGNNEEVLEAVRLGLDDLRGHMERKLDSPDRNQAQQSEFLDTINEGLETLRTDITKTLDKPMDMTVNYEILDTLKDGIAGLRSEIDSLKATKAEGEAPKGSEIVLAEPGEGAGEAREAPMEGDAPSTATGLKAADLEKMEVLLAQLQIKIEAMDNTIQEMPKPEPAAAPVQMPEGMAMKEDFTAMEGMIKEVQDNIVSLAAREPESSPENNAKKEDTDAIETLLRNTKSQLDEMVLPDPANAVTKEHLDAVEAVVRITNEAVEGLADRLENSTAAKADVAVVEVLAQDVKTALDELKEKMASTPGENEEKPELITKADFDVLGLLCTEIKTKVHEMELPNPTEVPTKADIEQLTGLINDFRESHDKLKESYENDIAITAKAFDDRKQEFESTLEQITGVKDSISGIKDELLEKIGQGESGIDTLGETLKGLEEKAGNHEPIVAEVKEVMDALNREFERAHGALEAMKVDNLQAAESSLEKQAENKESVVSALTEKLDGLFDGLMSKYDDAQRAAEEKAKTMEEKSASQSELLDGTKSMAEDLRLSIDTLGGTLTTFAEGFPEQMEKLTEESKTVFHKVDEAYQKLDETSEVQKGEHSATREEVVKVMSAITGVQNDMTEHNPRFLMTLEEVKALIGQHYEHSQGASSAAAEHHQAVRELQEQLKAGFEDSKTRHEAHAEDLKTALPALLPPPAEPPAPVEKYDDTALHEKLNTLMGHAEKAADPSTQLERLDQIHEKVMSTAAEVSAFVAAQSKQMMEEHESKEREAEELALLLERRQVQKDEIETDITVLNEEKDSLRQAVEALRSEKESLSGQKSRLTADVSSLETALHIRRDELHEMDSKAELIERRMMEGVMNQSRMLLLSKSSKPASKKKPAPQGRDLRVPSSGSTVSTQTANSSVPPLKANHSLAMKSRPALSRVNPQANAGERRIMSLNEISHNVPSGGQGYPASTNPSLLSNSGIKRSHSVKNQASQAMRKASGGGKRNLSASIINKENSILSEESEDEFGHDDSHYSSNYERTDSDAGTERRHSYMSGTESTGTYGDRSYADGPTPGGESELSYATGSYLTGSDVDRRTSMASSANGVVGLQSAIDEEPDENEDTAGEDDATPPQIEAPSAEMEKVPFAPPSDSGVGTDLPTTALNPSESDYFKDA
ncbi:hypothetical protein NU219Hw_g5399t1 [Hortaea werneckii]